MKVKCIIFGIEPLSGSISDCSSNAPYLELASDLPSWIPSQHCSVWLISAKLITPGCLRDTNPSWKKLTENLCKKIELKTAFKVVGWSFSPSTDLLMPYLVHFGVLTTSWLFKIYWLLKTYFILLCLKKGLLKKLLPSSTLTVANTAIHFAVRSLILSGHITGSSDPLLPFSEARPLYVCLTVCLLVCFFCMAAFSLMPDVTVAFKKVNKKNLVCPLGCHLKTECVSLSVQHVRQSPIRVHHQSCFLFRHVQSSPELKGSLRQSRGETTPPPFHHHHHPTFIYSWKYKKKRTTLVSFFKPQSGPFYEEMELFWKMGFI